MTTEKSSLFSQPQSSDETKTLMSGIVWFITSGFLSVSINALMRILSEDYGYHPFQLVFFYSAMGTVFYLPKILITPSAMHSTRLRLYGLRAVLEVTGFSLVFASLTLLPFALFTTLTFTTPIIGAIMAVYFLGEKMTRRKIIALAMGFMGILIVSQPDTDAINWAVLLPIGASCCFASCAVCIRTLARTEPPMRIACITLAFMAILSSPLAIMHWQPVSLVHIPYIVAMAGMVAAVQFCIGQALQRIELTTAQPFLFLNLISSSVIAWMFFGEIVERKTIIGAACILIGIIYSVKRKPLNTNLGNTR